MQNLLKIPQTSIRYGDQGALGATFIKPTGWLTNAPFFSVVEQLLVVATAAAAAADSDRNNHYEPQRQGGFCVSLSLSLRLLFAEW